MLGGYSDVARELNRVYDWPDERVVTRQWVRGIHLRATPNRWRQLPPSPVEIRSFAKHGKPRLIFDTAAWVTYVAPGVRGERRKGWVIPVNREAQPAAS